MIIGMILDSNFPPDVRVENEALTLINEGHEVHLFCVDYNHNIKKNEVINQIKISRKKMRKHLYKFSALAYTIPYYHTFFRKAITEFIKKNNIQALHIHDIQIARSVFWANKKLKLPIILDLHENRPEIMKHYAHVNSIPGKLLIKPSKWKKYEFKFINKANKVIVVTNEAKKHYVNQMSADQSKIHVVPNTIRQEFYSKYEKDETIISRYKDNYTILYLGDTGLRRGLEVAIKSLKHLIPAIPEIKLVIVGNSKTDNILKKLVAQNKWENYVDFWGWQDLKSFQSFILACDIGICPFHKNIHHDTTYANKLFQYLSFGKPVIVSNCTSQQRLVEKYNCGLVFQDRDVKDFSEKVIALYHDKELYDHLSQNALTAIKESLNWDVLSKELIKLYQQI